MKRMIFIAETRPDNQVIRQELTPIPASDAAADNADNNASVRGESGRGEVRDDVDVDDIAMLLRGGGVFMTVTGLPARKQRRPQGRGPITSYG